MNAPPYDIDETARRGINPLAIAVFAVALGLGSLLIWLSFAGHEPPETALVLSLDTQPAPQTPEVLLEGRPGAPPQDIPPAAPPSPANGQQKLGRLAPLAPGASLAEAPFPGLFEQAADGAMLPVIAPDGRRAVASYARPFAPRTGPDGTALPQVAVIVSGLGLNRTFTERSLEQLPADISLAFTPYTPELQDMIATARADGHEVAIELPMEPYDYPDNDPGPYTLLTGLPPEANGKRLEWLLSRGTGYFAVVNRQGGRYMADRDAMAATLATLASRGIGFIDTGDRARTVTGAAAPPGYEFAVAAQVIDAARSPSQINRTLAALERTARDTGFALGIGTALPITVERLAEWAPSLEAKGIQLVPVSAALIPTEDR